MISVIVCTLNQNNKIDKCIESILNGKFRDFEIIIVNQGINRSFKKNSWYLNDSKIKVLYLKKPGLSKARNYGIEKSRGDIIAFTDDDCIADKQWLININKEFQLNINLWAQFGKVLPYGKKPMLGSECPCVFQEKARKLFTTPVTHWDNYGFGNNMAFKRNLFENIGKFSHILGLGSIGLSAEDAEFSTRLLYKGYKLLYNPNVIIYHNRWILKNDIARATNMYDCGEMACYGYYRLEGLKLADKTVKISLNQSYNRIKHELIEIVKTKRFSGVKIIELIANLLFKTRGLLVANVLFTLRKFKLLINN